MSQPTIDPRSHRVGQVAAYEAILRELAELSARVQAEVAALTLPTRAPQGGPPVCGPCLVGRHDICLGVADTVTCDCQHQDGDQ